MEKAKQQDLVNAEKSRFATKYIISSNKDNESYTGRSAFLQETRDNISKQSTDPHHLTTPGWFHKSGQKPDNSRQSNLFNHVKNNDLPMTLELDREQLVTDNFPHESPSDSNIMPRFPLSTHSASQKLFKPTPTHQLQPQRSLPQFNLINPHQKHRKVVGQVHF